DYYCMIWHSNSIWVF
nr:immunoglobulin light chain junction region [Macaca mulatta]